MARMTPVTRARRSGSGSASAAKSTMGRAIKARLPRKAAWMKAPRSAAGMRRARAQAAATPALRTMPEASTTK